MIGAFLAEFVVKIIGAWAAMILLGMAHGYDTTVPALGYFVVFLLVLAVSVVAATVPKREP